jgi:transglutaminase-like putative cysteine protease
LFKRKKMRNSTVKPIELDAIAISWLTVALGLALLPHLTHLPIWSGVLFAGTVGWRWWVAQNPSRQLPKPWLRASLTLLIVVLVFYSFKTLFGREAGVALLAAMAAMKFLESRTLRDGLILLMLGYFLVMANLLYSQSLLMAGYLLAILVVMLAAQTMTQRQHSAIPIKAVLRLNLRTVLQGLPVMLILFVLFPRIPGPLWGMPKDAHSGLTGLDDKMTPGAISQLIKSDEVAFRVRFSSPIPPPNQRYWRGPVLWRYDGVTWTRSTDLPRKEFPYTVEGESIDYSVIVEPYGKRWLFALDLPYRLPPEAGITRGLELMRKTPVNELTRYKMSSYPNYQTGPLETTWRWRSLRLPEDTDPQTRRLAQEWRSRYAKPEQIVQAALRYFREEPFYYTLSPPGGLVDNNIDRFLFETRRGFCEHYAGSFVFLMRAAGVPARVVTGYQGGESNALSDYFIVRQSDAHAWAEVWLQGRGWTRVDPTAAVSPARIERGIQAAVDLNDLPFMARRDNSWRQDLSLRWDSFNNLWNEWVLSYGPERQREFLSGLGFGPVDWRGMTTAMVALLGVLSLLAVGWQILRRRTTHDPVIHWYQRFCNKLARRGLTREIYEGPVDFTERVAQQRPDIAPQVRRIGHLYAKLRYSRNLPTAESIEALRRGIRQLRV